jgi:hypothetical protein
VALAAAALATAGCGGGSDEVAQTTTARAAGVPAPIVTTPRRAAPRIDASPGSVRVEDGPFTDRVTLAGVRLAPGRRASVTGRLNNAVDVSELIVLELQADFYDEAGRLVGTGRQVFEDAHARPGEPPLDFSIRAPASAPPAASAVLSIPQLVNE